MQRAATPPESPDSHESHNGDDARRGASHNGHAYDREFWFAYGANISIMVTVSLMFRYSDFVVVLGGSEWHLGWIVGLGTIGSLAVRLAQGVGIDHHGPRKIWLLSLLLVAVSLALHILIGRVDGPMIFALRILYHCSVAGSFAAQLTYISLRAPAGRMAEVIGVLGTSGFIGMSLGSLLGDVLCQAETLDRWHLDRLFLVAAAGSLASLLCAAFATHGEIHEPVRRRPPMLWLIRRYYPGRMLLMGVIMGVGIGLPHTFVRPFAAQLHIQSIGTFFATYAVTAFVMRLATRRLPMRIGIPATVLLGMAAMCASMMLYMVVQTTWQLVFPAVAAGLAHAFLFPSIVTGATVTFPTRYRGIGTALILAMFDIGNLVGMPLAGSIVEYAGIFGWPAYPTMFLVMTFIVASTSVYYVLRPRRSEIRRSSEDRRVSNPAAEPAEMAETLA